MARRGKPSSARGRSAKERDQDHVYRMAQLHARADRRETLTRGFVQALFIASFAIPLLAFGWAIEPLSGKTTVVEANIIVTVGITVSVAVNAMQWVKGRSQKAELERARERETRLEERLLPHGEDGHG